MAFTQKIVSGALSASDINTICGDLFPEYVVSGFEVTEDTGLDVSISDGEAWVKDANGNLFIIKDSESDTLTMTDDTTNYIFLHASSTYLTTSTNSAVPTDAILLATVVTSSGSISTITDNRQTYPKEKEFITYSVAEILPGSSTEERYIMLNQTYDSIIEIEKIKYTVSGGSTTVSCYYNIGDGDVLVGTGNINNTLNVKSTNRSYPCYIKIITTSSTYQITSVTVDYWREH